MKQILNSLVGSRLHGLYNEQSDYDWKGIYMKPLIEIISPFKKSEDVQYIKGNKENSNYELIHFIKLAAQSNPTVLEVIWSKYIQLEDSTFFELIDNRQKFLDSKKIYDAHLGYSYRQIKKMSLENPNERTPKTIVAFVRVLRQGEELLRTGNFNPVYEYEDKDFLMDVKYNFNPKLIPHINKKMAEVRNNLENTYVNSKLKMEPDIDWIEDFILRKYKNT